MRSLRIAGVLFGLLLAVPPAWADGAPHLLGNLNRGAFAISSEEEPLGEPAGFFELGGRLFFSTATGDPQSLDQGILWRTDGSARGTEQISTTLCPPRCFSIEPLATWRGITLLRMRFNSDGFDSAYRLGRTDGTSAGSFPLTGDLYNDEYSNPLQVYFVAGADDFFFSACEESACLLRQSDGTRAGTTVFHGVDGRPFFDPARFTVWRDRLYFIASRGDGQERGLWSTDGTPGGTRLIRNGDVGPLVATPSRLFFTSGEESEELWVTDGTPAGTRRLAEFVPPGVDSINASGDEVYFALRPGEHRVEIWRSDGTSQGTRPLTQLPPGICTASHFQRIGRRWLFVAGGDLWTAEEGFQSPAPLACPGGCPSVYEPPYSPAPGVWLFSGYDNHGVALWSTDGTGPGTRRLSFVCFDFQLSPGGPEPDLFPGPAGKIYFRGCPRGGYAPEDHHLWVTDGSPAGTYEVGGPVSAFGFLHGRVYFGRSPASGPGAELWETDVRPGLGRRIATLRRYKPGSDPQFQASGNRVLVAATPKVDRVALWTSDGTPGGTLPIVDLPDDVPRFFTQFLGPVGSRQLFGVVHYDLDDPNGDETPEIWRTDGTAQGTQLVAVLPRKSFIYSGTPWNGKLLVYYSHDSGLGGCSLAITDGTTLGTRELFFHESSTVCHFPPVVVGSSFLYLAPAGSITQLFLSDGTAAGTRPIATFEGFHGWFPGPVQIGNTFFFKLASQSSSQVWQTDGTPAGTRLASPLTSVDDLYAFQGSLYLTAPLSDDPDEGRGIFRIRPGSAPVLLAKIRKFSWVTDPPLRYAPVGDRLLFGLEDLDPGFQVWATDGTPTGTRLIRRFELLPNAPFPDPETLVSAGDRAFFAASDGVHGRELWESDGTPEGTRMVADLAPGGYAAIPAPSTLAVANGYLFFAADDGKTGPEPWALPLSP
jgi:ELWxxDGT repeat protein